MKFNANFESYHHGRLNVFKDIIQEKSINHYDTLGKHINPIYQPLMEQQQIRRLKKLFPAELIEG
jgi:hypothetical protein